MAAIKICSWNINGMRATVKTGDFQSWLASSAPDIIGLQEVKAAPDQVVPALWEPLGYTAYWHPAERSGYSGALLLTKVAPLAVRVGIGVPEFDIEGRLIEAEFPGFTLFTVYFPNGGKGDRLPFKLRFFETFLARADAVRATEKSVVFMGDVNIAHREIDVARPDGAKKGTGFLPEERAWIDRFADHGYVDTFRALHPAVEGAYSYWDAWRERRARNVGWRIDYVFVSEELRPRVTSAFIESDVMGSDHCPVGIELESGGESSPGARDVAAHG
jgi:exodeoxyribonuclease-3